MKKSLDAALARIGANSLAFLKDPALADRIREIAASAFVPLYDECKKKSPCSIVTKQIGDVGFRVVKTTNLLDVKIGSMLTPRQAEKMREDGISFTVMRNS